MSSTIQDVMSQNPTIQIIDHEFKNGKLHITGFIDMNISTGYGNIIKMKDKSFSINVSTGGSTSEKDLIKCKRFRDLMNLLNIK